MCVIIYIPVGETISKQELQNAWNVNSDGAGFTVLKKGQKSVHYEKGFMSFDEYFNAVHPYIGGCDLVLHFRISTSNTINQVQTHPFELHNKFGLFGDTINPLIFMNGVITGQKEYTGMNDTMSFIQDHAEAFQLIADNNCKDLLNIIAEYTGCRWCMVTTDEVLITDNFTKYKGRYYSNKNHISRKLTSYKTATDYCYLYRGRETPANHEKPEQYLKPKIWRKVQQDRNLYLSLKDFLYFATEEEAETLKYANTITELKTHLTYLLFYS